MSIKLTPIKRKKVTLWIKGTSPLIQHAWGEKSLNMLRKTSAERRKEPKVGRDPEGEADAATYYTQNGQYAIPAMAFKSAVIGAAHKDIGLEKTLVRKSLFVVCDDPDTLLAMECETPRGREDIVRVGQGQTDLRYRPEFRNWRVKVIMEINAETLNEQDLVNLINRAGFGVGIGEWRPEKGGDYGRFEVDENEPVNSEEL